MNWKLIKEELNSYFCLDLKTEIPLLIREQYPDMANKSDEEILKWVNEKTI